MVLGFLARIGARAIPFALPFAKKAALAGARGVSQFGTQLITKPVPTLLKTASALTIPPLVFGFLRKKPEILLEIPKKAAGAGGAIADILDRPNGLGFGGSFAQAPSNGDDKLTDILTEVGKIGAAGALTAGALFALQKGLKKRREKKATEDDALTGLVPVPSIGGAIPPSIVGAIPVAPPISGEIMAARNGKVVKQAIPQIKLTSSPKINIVVQNAFS